VQGIAVDPLAQRAGIGRALIEAARVRARGAGARKLTLRVPARNNAAVRLYRAAGFARRAGCAGSS
jgi:ribosomal protein S18 acetylase RimI-like enzyme